MLIVRIWNYLIGYVIIRIEGLSLEKFINLAVSKGIHLWGIERLSYTSLRARVGINGFRKLKLVLRKVRCRVTIEEKRGLPFFTHQFKKRKMLIAGMFLCLAILYGLTSFVWIIEVHGNKKIAPYIIEKSLEKNGVRPGTWKGNINIPALENQMMIDLPQLSWIGLEVKGVKLISEIVEAVQPPALIDKDTPCNIVAVKDGIIAKMTVLEGKPVVEIGSTVKKGQLIVSGVIEHENVGMRYVHARGDIWARTWYEGKALVPLHSNQKIRTGKKAIRKYLKAGNVKIKVQEDPITFQHYEKIEKREPLLGENFLLPSEMITEEYYEIKQDEKKKSIEEIRQAVQDQAWKEAQKIIPKNAKVVDKQAKFSMIKGESIEAVVYVETLEPIGIQAPLSVNKEELKIEQPTAGKEN